MDICFKSDIITVSTGKDNVAPVAKAKFTSKTIIGYEASFDGSKSSDNFQISKYLWDFGDGTTAVGKEVNHEYTESGTYTVTLTVTDESGNTSTDTDEITVYNSDYSISEIKVVDSNGKPIAYSAAYVKSEGAADTQYFADKNGIIPIVAKAGTYDFYFFANNYLPNRQSITLEGIQTGVNGKTVVLSSDEIVTADFVIEELDIEEIEELGIDITAPENQYVCRVEMTITNDDSVGESSESGSDSSRQFNVYVNSSGEIIQVDHDDGFTISDKITTKKTITTQQGTSSVSTRTSTLQSGITNNSGKTETGKETSLLPLKTMVSLSVTEYSWLKDFYKVSVTFTNNSPVGFDILNPKATLSLPRELSLAEGSDALSVSMENIAGGDTETVSWIIRGNAKGVHNLTVYFDGTLTPFDVPITAEFSSSVTVEGGDALKLDIYRTSFEKAEFNLENISPTNDTLYNVCVDMSTYTEFNDAEYVVLKYPSGMIEKIEWTDENKTATKSTVYLPVTVSHNVDVVTLRTLEFGEQIEGVIYYTFRDADE